MYEKVYFASDFHLGLNAGKKQLDNLSLILQWMDTLEPHSKLYLLGDLFDYWYEYKNVIPRGHTKFLGKLHELRDREIDISIFTGNHDMWMYDFFTQEYDVPIYHEPRQVKHQGKNLLIGHGDGLGPGDRKYKIIKYVFRNKWSQRLFYMLHPDLALKIMRGFSQSSRDNGRDETYQGDDEWLYQYCEDVSSTMDIDYFVFGHRHLVIDRMLSNGKSRYINIGDWLSYYSYAVLENGMLQVRFFKESHKIYGT